MKLLLIFLVVFCGQIFAISDVEMLPRVMGPLKKNIESSKTWGDFFAKEPGIMNFADGYVFDQVVGMKTTMPQFVFSENMRVLTIGDEKVEIVNLSTMDFKVNGQLFRYEKGLSFFELKNRLNALKNKTDVAFYSLFSSVADAQNDKVSCTADAVILNQILTEKGIQKEVKNAAANATAAAVAGIGHKVMTMGDTKEQAADKCNDIIDQFQKIETKTQAKLIGLECTSKEIGSDAKLSFEVAAFIEGKNLQTNVYPPADPNRKETEDHLRGVMKGQMTARKQMDLLVNWQASEIRRTDIAKAYRFSDKGRIAESIYIERVNDGGKQKDVVRCGIGPLENMEKGIQLNNAAETIAFLKQHSLCSNPACLSKVQEIVKTNLGEAKGRMVGNLKSYEASPRCKEKVRQYVENPCYRYTNLVNDLAAIRCSAPVDARALPPKKSGECKQGPNPDGGRAGARGLKG